MPEPIEIDVHAVCGLIQSKEPFFFLDCREPFEHEIAAIAGATLIPMSELTSRIGELEPYRNERIVVHCHHGRRSLDVAFALRTMGFQQVQSMAGGIDVWSLEVDSTVPRY